MPTTHTLTCVYKLTAVGAVPVAALAARFAAIPVDLFLPNKVGLLYEADSTATVGQVVTRTIVLQARPTTDATGTATLFGGLPSGGPIDSSRWAWPVATTLHPRSWPSLGPQT